MTIKWIINTTNTNQLKCLLDVSIILECKFIYNELKKESFNDHFSDDMLEYANKLEECINKFDTDTLNIEENDETDKIQTIKFIINWLRFWGEYGYGFYVVLALN